MSHTPFSPRLSLLKGRDPNISEQFPLLSGVSEVDLIAGNSGAGDALL